jgi:hypothetical protein
MKHITAKELEIAKAYENAKPKQFGTLHERMKFVIKALEEARGWKTSEPDPEFDHFNPNLVYGIFDLETEVKYHAPQKPPFGKRAIRNPIRKPRRSN